MTVGAGREALSGGLNWSGEEGTGYHAPGLKHDALVRRLLMFYTANPQKADIPRASVTGTSPSIPWEDPVSVGLSNMYREPRH